MKMATNTTLINIVKRLTFPSIFSFESGQIKFLNMDKVLVCPKMKRKKDKKIVLRQLIKEMEIT